MSEIAPQVYAAISAVMAHMSKEGISKGRKNAQQGYNFRGIDDMYNALSSVLAENKLMILPFVQDMQREERATKNGGMLMYTILTVDFKFVSAVDGSHDTIRTVGEAMDTVDKSSNKAQSAALKYAAMQVFMIPTEGDNDADATTHEVRSASVITPAQELELQDLAREVKADESAFFKWANVHSFGAIPSDKFEVAKAALEKKRTKAEPKHDAIDADSIPY